MTDQPDYNQMSDDEIMSLVREYLFDHPWEVDPLIWEAGVEPQSNSGSELVGGLRMAAASTSAEDASAASNEPMLESIESLVISGNPCEFFGYGSPQRVFVRSPGGKSLLVIGPTGKEEMRRVELRHTAALDAWELVDFPRVPMFNRLSSDTRKGRVELQWH